MKRPVVAIAGCGALLATSLFAETFHVGPGRTLRSPQDAAPLLQPGDVLEVDGGTTYRGMISFDCSGTPENKITIRGIRVGGKRPQLETAGGVKSGAVVRFRGDHCVFEGFDVSTAGDTAAARGIYVVADDITIRDTAVHDCRCTGIHGSDSGGSLTLDGVEVFRCGAGDRAHQIYVATDNTRHPSAKFRMQFCRVHDGAGGNNVKTRAGRNEIYYNWIQGAAFHELDLIGADVAAQRPGTAGAVREDSDIVGNVLMGGKTSQGFIARLGSDGAGSSNARYRFVNNTMVIESSAPGVASVLRAQGALQSVEMHNNVIDHVGKPVRIFFESKIPPSPVAANAGSNNWLPRGSTGIPREWTGTIFGDDPGFANAGAHDFAPRPASPLRNAGRIPTQSPPGFDFPAPLTAPLFQPSVGDAPPAQRPRRASTDIGAFESPR